MTPRAVAALAAMALLAPLAACEANNGSPGGIGPQPGGADSTVTRPAQLPKTTDTVAALVRRGADSVTSVRFTVTAHLAAGRITGTGRETVQAGAVTAVAATLRSAGLPRTRVVIVGGTTYFRASSRSWRQLPADGGKSRALAVRHAVTIVAPLVSPAALVATVGSGRVRLLGSGVLASVPFARYSATTSVAALPVSAAHTAWARAGILTLWLDLRVERHGRPLVAQWRLAGAPARPAATALVRFRGYNRPLRITAPR